MDVSGEQQIDVDHNLFKKRLDLDGNPIDDRLHKEGTVFHITFTPDHNAITDKSHYDVPALLVIEWGGVGLVIKATFLSMLKSLKK